MCKVTNLLNSVEIEDLDAFEETVYNDLSKRMSKADLYKSLSTTLKAITHN